MKHKQLFAQTVFLLVIISLLSIADARGRRARIDMTGGGWSENPLQIQENSFIQIGPEAAPDQAPDLRLPMTLNIAGISYTHIYVYENGFISLGTNQDDPEIDFSSTATSMSEINGNVIAPLYADLDCTPLDEDPANCRINYDILSDPDANTIFSNAARISWGPNDDPPRGVSSSLEDSDNLVYFQMFLVDRSEEFDRLGDFDILFSYLDADAEVEESLTWENTPLISGVKTDQILLDFAALGARLYTTAPVDTDVACQSVELPGVNHDNDGNDENDDVSHYFFNPNVPMPCNYITIEFRDGQPNLKTFTSNLELSVGSLPSTMSTVENYTLDFAITNPEFDIASDVIVSLDVPDNTVFVDSSPSSVQCSSTIGQILCELEDIAVTPLGTFEEFSVTLRSEDVGLQEIFAEIKGSQYDSDSENNKTQASITTTPSADIALVSCNAVTSVTQNNSFLLSCDVSNNGPQTANNIDMNISLPSIVSFSSSSDCLAMGSTLTCSVNSLATGNSATISANLTGSTTGSGDILLSVSADEDDAVLSNNGPLSRTITVNPIIRPVIIDPPPSSGGGGSISILMLFALSGLIFLRRDRYTRFTVALGLTGFLTRLEKKQSWLM